MIKVLVVEDSPVVRELLIHILSSDPEIDVIGTATNGDGALEFVRSKQPDVITMDIHMPGMNGLEATRQIMETVPTPIVIVSGSSKAGEVANTFRAVEAGALTVVQRPQGIGHPDHAAMAQELVQTVKLMSEVRVVRRWPHARRGSLDGTAPVPTGNEVKRIPAEIRVIAMGASTGGPLALREILSRLPAQLPVPILIVQHMSAGFIEGFVEWLDQVTLLSIRVARHDEPLLPGHVYFAPDGFQMGVASGGRISLSRDAPENGLCPSVSRLFRSVAQVFGRSAVGVLLTGMGKDGAEELKMMRDLGSITIAQNEETSVVHGMPGHAMQLDAAMHVLSPESIAVTLAGLVKPK